MELLGRELRHSAYLVLDLETTGVDKDARIVEIAAFGYHPGEPPRLMLDTLVDPQRPIPAEASRIHGITDADVRGAPTLGQLGPALAALLASRVLVAHNAAFDVRILTAELGRLARLDPFPYLCTMRLPKLLGLGEGNWPLWFACQQLGVALPHQAHAAQDDAQATAALLHQLIGRCADLTFRELQSAARRRRLTDPFLASLDHPPWRAPLSIVHAGQLPLKPRHQGPAAAPPEGAAQTYLEAVLAAIQDLRLEPAAQRALEAARASLPAPVVDQVHGRIWRGARKRHREKGYVTAEEAVREDRLRGCLVQLGFQPWPP